jgi:hypothetical protein
MNFGIDLAPGASGVLGRLQHALGTMVETFVDWPLFGQIFAGVIACGVIFHIVCGLRK